MAIAAMFHGASGSLMRIKEMPFASNCSASLNRAASCGTERQTAWVCGGNVTFCALSPAAWTNCAPITPKGRSLRTMQ